MRYRRSKRPLPLFVLRRTAVEIAVMPIRKVHWQCVAVDGVGRDPSQRRLLSRDILATHGLDLEDQSLIRRQIQRLVRDDDFAIEMCTHGHSGTPLFQYRRNADVFQADVFQDDGRADVPHSARPSGRGVIGV